MYIYRLLFIPSETKDFTSGIKGDRGISGIFMHYMQNDELIRGTVVVFRKVRQYNTGVDCGGVSLVIG